MGMKSSDLNDSSNAVSGRSLSPTCHRHFGLPPARGKVLVTTSWNPGGSLSNECCLLHYTHTMSAPLSLPILGVVHGPGRHSAILHDEGIETRVSCLREVVIPVAVDGVNGERRCGTPRVRWTLVTVCHCQTVRSTWRQRLAAEGSASSALGGELPVCAVDTRAGLKYLIRRVTVDGR